MNKKISISFVFVVIIIISGTIGGIFYFGSNDENQQMPIDNKQKNLASELAKQYDVLINKDNEIYEIDLVTKELSLYDKNEINLSEFIGLPKEIESEKISVINFVRVESLDRSKIIVQSVTNDKTEMYKYTELPKILKASEFICDVIVKKCSSTNYLEETFNAIGINGNWYNSEINYKWDSVKNILYGNLKYYVAHGSGNTAPVYSYNLNTKKLQQTNTYNPKDVDDATAVVFHNSFSPSFSKLIMVEKSNINGIPDVHGDVVLYDTNNLASPLKKFNVPSITDKNNDNLESVPPGIDFVVWSSDEKKIILKADRGVFVLDLESGLVNKIGSVSNDVSGCDRGWWTGDNNLALIENNVFYLDGNRLIFVDLNGSGESFELLQEKGIFSIERRY